MRRLVLTLAIPFLLVGCGGVAGIQNDDMIGHAVQMSKLTDALQTESAIPAVFAVYYAAIEEKLAEGALTEVESRQMTAEGQKIELLLRRQFQGVHATRDYMIGSYSALDYANDVQITQAALDLVDAWSADGEITVDSALNVLSQRLRTAGQ